MRADSAGLDDIEGRSGGDSREPCLRGGPHFDVTDVQCWPQAKIPNPKPQSPTIETPKS